ncbi:MAG TPA: YceI family protein [Flavobacterium sp.]|nr:YceI family protein [Flavobacterium sp.]
MKKVVLSLIIVAGLSFATVSCKKSAEAKDAEAVAEATAEAVTFNVNTTESTIEWKGSKVITGSHNGTIALSSGEISVKDGVVEAGSFVIDMNSITVLDIEDEEKKGWLEGHLKGAGEDNADHFFNVSEFPEGKFEITSVSEGNIEGNLTLKGITKNVKFPATITVSDNDVTIIAEPFNIDRTLWGVNYSNESMTDVAKDNIISNNIELKLNVKASK